MTLPRFGLNRFDARSVDAFAADVRRAETLGWDAALHPIPNPTMPDDPERGFMARVAREVLAPVRDALGTRSSKGA